MQRLLSGLLVFAIVIGAGYWYHTANSRCPVPISYSIGELDTRFGLSREEVRTILSEAESLWEDETGQNLFTYDPASAFTVNFIFDARQELTLEEHSLREVLDRKEEVSDSLRGEYNELLSQYNAIKATYESRVASYENRLATYNGEVAYWNTRGGAPQNTYVHLNAERQALAAENAELSALAQRLNTLVDGINLIGEKSNRTIREYNDRVAEYNDRFHEEREFTQGDYRDGRINIYQYQDLDELKLVLAHEFGHALSLGHVEDSASVMHYLMGDQKRTLTLSDNDRAEFERVCGAR